MHLTSEAHRRRCSNSSGPMPSRPKALTWWALLQPSAQVLQWFLTLSGVKCSSKSLHRLRMMINSSTDTLLSPSLTKPATWVLYAAWRQTFPAFKLVLRPRTRVSRAADLVSTIAWPVSSEGSSRSIADARRVRQFLREASLLRGVLGLAGRVSAPAFNQSGSSPLALCTIHAAIDLFKFMLATHRRESLPTCLVKEGKQVSPFASVNIFCRSLPKPSIAIACRSHARSTARGEAMGALGGA
mmetsp:Transcript_83692/g.270602  ORF Transcript_83692/g.270602 Transcript_83692/m.270602 type:complete len:242 (-) Transcript_83692:16-741(-)